MSKSKKRVIVITGCFVLAPVIFVLIAANYFSFESRFRRSRPALEQYAAQVVSSDLTVPIPPVPRRLGAFETGDAERLPHGFLFFADYGHPLDANGIAYSTEPLPDEINGDYFTQIEGPWYQFVRNNISQAPTVPTTQSTQPFELRQP